MADRYTSFRNTDLGSQLAALAEDDARYPEYGALCRVGVPPVAALVQNLKTRFPEVRGNDFAKQALGAFVGNVMRAHRHNVVGRGRVPGGFFTYGTTWSDLPRPVPTAKMAPGELVMLLRSALPELHVGWPIRSLAVFGSRARGDAREDSDLDALVTFERPVSMSSFLALEARLAEITGLRVDLVSAGGLRPYIGERIRAEAIRL
jgi:predicted nucleotidyltransferase